MQERCHEICCPVQLEKHPAHTSLLISSSLWDLISCAKASRPLQGVSLHSPDKGLPAQCGCCCTLRLNFLFFFVTLKGVPGSKGNLGADLSSFPQLLWNFELQTMTLLLSSLKRGLKWKATSSPLLKSSENLQRQ